jgi:hypothetical protein
MFMTELFKKLNFKAQKEIYIINSPKEFSKELTAMKEFTSIKTNIKNQKNEIFILIFVTNKIEIENYSSTIIKDLKGDSIIWFAYPKGTSKKYKVEISRDKGWDSIGTLGYESVRAVAIDEDWSTLRFRKVEFVKTMVRDPKIAISIDGKAKTK